MVAMLIETSTERSIVAFFDRRVLFLKEFPVGLSSSKELFPAIHQGLKELGIAISQLSFIAVGVGPGSYTGMRVGAMAAKAMAYAAKIPLVALPSLMCFFPLRQDAERCFAVVVDAKIAGGYAIMGCEKQGKIEYFSPPQVMPLAALGEFLLPVSLIVTPRASKIRPKLESLFPDHPWQWQESPPDAAHMGLLASEKFSSGDVVSSDTLDLLYLREWQGS